MQRPPKFSIVTPSFNQAAFIEEALLSVKSQNYPDVEHIVIDGASSDGTVEILKRFSSQPGWEHLHWVSEPDRGQSDALNKGFQMATGSIVGWLNSDERYRPECLQEAVAAFSEHTAVDVIYGDYTWIDETGRVFQVRRETEFNYFVLLYHRVLHIHTPATFFRGRIFAEGNLLDVRLQHSMDYEFFLRLVQMGYRFKHIPKLLADFRWHPESKSASQVREIFLARDRVVNAYSPILRNLREGFSRKLVLGGLRTVAAALRYSEKLLRGYYFEQFHSGTSVTDPRRECESGDARQSSGR